MNKWDPVDWVVVIIAFSMAVSMIVTTIVPLILDAPISDARGRYLSGIATTMIGVIGVYVGNKMKGSKQ